MKTKQEVPAPVLYDSLCELGAVLMREGQYLQSWGGGDNQSMKVLLKSLDNGWLDPEEKVLAVTGALAFACMRSFDDVQYALDSHLVAWSDDTGQVFEATVVEAFGEVE